MEVNYFVYRATTEFNLYLHQIFNEFEMKYTGKL